MITPISLLYKHDLTVTVGQTDPIPHQRIFFLHWEFSLTVESMNKNKKLYWVSIVQDYNSSLATGSVYVDHKCTQRLSVSCERTLSVWKCCKLPPDRDFISPLFHRRECGAKCSMNSCLSSKEVSQYYHWTSLWLKKILMRYYSLNSNIRQTVIVTMPILLNPTAIRIIYSITLVRIVF